MENIIEYYYNLMINSIKKKDNNYIIKVKNNYFVLKEIDNIDNISDIYDLSKRLTINTIIPNKDNKLYTNIIVIISPKTLVINTVLPKD